MPPSASPSAGSSSAASSAAAPPDRSLFGLPKLPARYAGIVLPFLLSILMTIVVSFISTLRGVGWVEGFGRIWFGAWWMSWIVAFPTLLMVLPLVRRLTAALVRQG